MERRQMGALVIAVGVLAILVAVLADPLGIGGKEDTFGWKQITLLVVGVVVALGGLVVIRRPAGGEPAGGAERSGGAQGPSPSN
jgi:hypothetical protein